MKSTFILAFCLIQLSISFAQSSIEFIGCWEAILIVDTMKNDTLKKIKNQDFLSFEGDETFQMNKWEGNYQFNSNDQTMILQKLNYTEEDRQMAKDLNQSLQEVTTMTLFDFHIDGQLLYYKAYGEEIPVVYICYKKVKCKD